MFFSKSKQ